MPTVVGNQDNDVLSPELSTEKGSVSLGAIRTGWNEPVRIKIEVLLNEHGAQAANGFHIRLQRWSDCDVRHASKTKTDSELYHHLDRFALVHRAITVGHAVEIDHAIEHTSGL